jgi:AraC-like DNA-binding protein
VAGGAFRQGYSCALAAYLFLHAHGSPDPVAAWCDDAVWIEGLQLARREVRLGASEACLLTENLCNLLALATARDPEAQERQPPVQLEEVLAFSRRHLSDPDLSPQMIAAHCRISVRTVHLRFERIGQSFSRWLVDNRLEACRRDLRDPCQAASSVSEIAYRWGFSDLSHFNRSFRAKFGMTPREWRADAVVRPAPG